MAPTEKPVNCDVHVSAPLADPTISIVTPTLNAAGTLARLMDSLRAQTDSDFQFIVIDGGSSDGTQALIAAASDIVTFTSSEPDHGFYDALNKGIRAVQTDYYLVVGADDTLAPDAVSNFKSQVRKTGADVVVAGVQAGNRVRRGYHADRGWLGHAAMVTSHSVGMLFRSNLHERFGEYSRRYPILADGHFIKRVCQTPGIKVCEADFIAGNFGLQGMTNRNFINICCETWQIQIDTGEKPVLQFLLFQLRLLRYLPRIIVK